MKILSVEDIRKADSYTIEHEPVESFNLMKRASEGAARFILKNTNYTKFVVLCGVGNNGGDGLVIAKYLSDAQFAVRVAIVNFSILLSDDFIKAKTFLGEKCPMDTIGENNFNEFNFQKDECIIDAMLGSGLNKPPSGWFAQWIRRVNTFPNEIIAIDFPSGLFAEKTSDLHSDSIIEATRTVTFELPKFSMFMPENQKYCGDWKVIPIGLHATFIENAHALAEFVDEEMIYKMIIPRPREGHKGTFGHALLVAGNTGKYGAAVLAAKALLRSGCGLSTLLVPFESMSIFHSIVPEVMLHFYEQHSIFGKDSSGYTYTSCGIGPGLGLNDRSMEYLEKILIQKKPTVIDADAINILAGNKELKGKLHDKVILTPHIGEFDRLAGKSENHFERLEKARSFCQMHSVTILLKGRFSATVTSDGFVYFNPTGTQSMAKGGSGDVLTGFITGLLAQGYQTHEAAILGSYLHGLSGQLAARHLSDRGMKSGDIADFLPDAWLLAENQRLNTDVSFIEAI